MVLNITFSKAAGQDNNITEQTACEQVLYMSIHGIWEVGDEGVYTLAPTPASSPTSRKGMRWNLVTGISLVQ